MTDQPGEIGPLVDGLLRLLNDPEYRDQQRQRLAEHEAARTDPWVWYCRLCGAEGQDPDRITSNGQAMSHIAPGQPCGRGSQVGSDQAGRLLHVWTYSLAAHLGSEAR